MSGGREQKRGIVREAANHNYVLEGYWFSLLLGGYLLKFCNDSCLSC